MATWLGSSHLTPVALAGALLAVHGCTSAVTTDVREVSVQRAADGKGIVALTLKYRDHEEPFSITVDHAFLIDWDEDPAKRRFYVYDRPGGRVQIPRDYDEFLRCLDQLPRDCQVGWINTCCAPISDGMTDEDRERLKRVMANGNRRILKTTSSDDIGFWDLCVCTCETVGMRFPGE